MLGVLEGPQALVANPPACTPPPDYRRRGPGGLRLPFGLAFHGDYLYVGNTDSIVRFEYRSGDLEARGAPEKLLDLPTGGHSTRNIVFNRAGTKLYIAVGSASNSDAGEDCRRAAILEVNPDGTGARIYASGIRNPVGLTLQPGTDVVWAATNERDNLGDDLVPDYATSVKDGGFYGWPYSYIGRHYDPKYVGAFPDLVGRAIVPDVLAACAFCRAWHRVLHRLAVSREIPQRRVRGAARIVEPDGRIGVPRGVLPDGERQAGPDRRLPDRLPGQHRRERHTRSAVGTPGGRDRRSGRRAARLGRQRQPDLEDCRVDRCAGAMTSRRSQAARFMMTRFVADSSSPCSAPAMLHALCGFGNIFERAEHRVPLRIAHLHPQ